MNWTPACARVFETTHDDRVLPGIYLVARLDGRSFTRLTREVHRFEASFDWRFRDRMLDTAAHLLAEFSARYAYTQSDGISLLFPLNCTLFNRKLRKLNSVLAGQASACFSLALGTIAAFDCRICELPRTADVINYFRWRSEDAHRNALNAHCYWALRKAGLSGETAAAALRNRTIAEKNEWLFQHGINFNDLPNWQKRGAGIYWEHYDKAGGNPVTRELVVTQRRRLHRNLDLPMKGVYSAFIASLLVEEIP